MDLSMDYGPNDGLLVYAVIHGPLSLFEWPIHGPNLRCVAQFTGRGWPPPNGTKSFSKLKFFSFSNLRCYIISLLESFVLE